MTSLKRKKVPPDRGNVFICNFCDFCLVNLIFLLIFATDNKCLTKSIF